MELIKQYGGEILFSLIFITIGIVIMWHIPRVCAKHLKELIRVTGTVVRNEERPVYDRDRRGNKLDRIIGTEYAPIVSFYFEGETREVAGFPLETKTRLGKECIVGINPRNPEDASVINPETERALPIIIRIFGSVFLLVGLCFFIPAVVRIVRDVTTQKPAAINIQKPIRSTDILEPHALLKTDKKTTDIPSPKEENPKPKTLQEPLKKKMDTPAEKEVFQRKFVHLCRRGTVAQLEQALAAGADVNAPDSFGELPLKSAIIGGDLQKVQFLLQHGATVTPQLVSYAETYDNEELLSLLKSAGAKE